MKMKIKIILLCQLKFNKLAKIKLNNLIYLLKCKYSN